MQVEQALLENQDYGLDTSLGSANKPAWESLFCPVSVFYPVKW
jgi:hypothetical protein